jgi:hypothetical protein
MEKGVKSLGQAPGNEPDGEDEVFHVRGLVARVF